MKTNKQINNRLLAYMGFALLLASASASANLIANGDFGTGALAPEWTTFTTAGGTIGTPAVVSFDVTGGGASNAAEFLVGRVPPSTGPNGGGIFQSFTSNAGTLSATLDIAAYMSTSDDNLEGGVFSVLLDNVVQDTHAFGFITAGSTLRSSLAFIASVAAGTHELRILITRPYTTTSGEGATPFQYVDNVVVNGPASVPEPDTLALFVIGAGALSRRLAARRAKQ